MHTFWRLLGFLRPYRRAVLVSFALAAVAIGTGILIPALVGRTVNEISGDGDQLWPLALAVVAAGVLRLVFSVARRIVAGQVSLGVEYDLRNRMYAHLHSLELSFFDSQQTGQLMSRATVDLQAVRFFLGYGLIFILQSALTILIAAGVMVVLDPWLALVSLAPMPFVIWISFRYGRRNRPASQEVQQRIAELTAEAEENIGGVRVVKAFAQEDRQLGRFDDTDQAGLRPVDGLHPAARLLLARSSASSPSSASPRCCSSAASRSSTASSPRATSSPSTGTCCC